MTKYLNLDQTKAYSLLTELAKKNINLKELLNEKRLKSYLIENPPLSFSYATSLVNDDVINLLQNLSEEQKVMEKYSALLAGEFVNVGEKRKVLHHQPRSKNKGFYGEEQIKIAEFTKKIHQGKIKGFSGKPFDTVVQIGIGGSDLGPRALYYALERYVLTEKGKIPLSAYFIANVDPDDANFQLSKINLETTLFIVVSKSGTTQETLTNLEFVREFALKNGMTDQDLAKHFIAVTGKGSPMDDPKKYLASFYIDDYIGGRFSSTSAVGGVVLSLAFGAEIFTEILDGACALDESAKEPNIRKNMTLLSALIGIWERNFLNLPSKAIIPYSEALLRFPAHLQQADCESNGKSVNVYFEKINYQTGPVIFGEPGTNAQHSFFQKLHQGSDVIPIQFIGFKEPQIKNDLSLFGSTSQQKLNANLSAQIIALALGQDNENLNKVFNGNRPTTLVFAEKLTPYTLGALLAFYENVIMFQGFIWNINSFDQEGVQLGKLLTKQLLEPGYTNPILQTLFSYLRI